MVRIVEVPDSCRECKHHKKCKKKNYARGSKLCRRILGDRKKDTGGNVRPDQVSTSLLWYYYNQSKR